MKNSLFTVVMFVLMAFTFQSISAQNAAKNQVKEKVKTEQTKKDIKPAVKAIWNKVCPVMGNAVNPKAPTVEYNGKTIGFCCAGCDAKFQKEPEKYFKNLSSDGSKFVGKK